MLSYQARGDHAACDLLLARPQLRANLAAIACGRCLPSGRPKRRGESYATGGAFRPARNAIDLDPVVANDQLEVLRKYDRSRKRFAGHAGKLQSGARRRHVEDDALQFLAAARSNDVGQTPGFLAAVAATFNRVGPSLRRSAAGIAQSRLRLFNEFHLAAHWSGVAPIAGDRSCEPRYQPAVYQTFSLEPPMPSESAGMANRTLIGVSTSSRSALAVPSPVRSARPSPRPRPTNS